MRLLRIMLRRMPRTLPRMFRGFGRTEDSQEGVRGARAPLPAFNEGINIQCIEIAEQG